MKKIAVLISMVLTVGCATPIPAKHATMISESGTIHRGSLIYDGPYSGNLMFPGGADKESFEGRFTVVDRTAVKSSSASLVVPAEGVIPGVGASSSSESRVVNAEGYWFGEGSRGTTIKCTLVIGLQGHGSGNCSSSDGQYYEITI